MERRARTRTRKCVVPCWACVWSAENSGSSAKLSRGAFPMGRADSFRCRTSQTNTLIEVESENSVEMSRTRHCQEIGMHCQGDMHCQETDMHCQEMHCQGDMHCQGAMHCQETDMIDMPTSKRRSQCGCPSSSTFFSPLPLHSPTSSATKNLLTQLYAATVAVSSTTCVSLKNPFRLSATSSSTCTPIVI